MKEIMINNKALSENDIKMLSFLLIKLDNKKMKLFIKLTMLKLKQGMRSLSYPVYHAMA